MDCFFLFRPYYSTEGLEDQPYDPYRLFVIGVGQEITNTVLKAYFDDFCEVDLVYRWAKDIAVVIFKYAVGVRFVLSCTPHSILSSTVTVQISIPWRLIQVFNTYLTIFRKCWHLSWFFSSYKFTFVFVKIQNHIWLVTIEVWLASLNDTTSYVLWNRFRQMW